jgi:hypothetical protein
LSVDVLEIMKPLREQGIRVPPGQWDPEPWLWRRVRTCLGASGRALDEVVNVVPETGLWPLIFDSNSGSSLVYGSAWGVPEFSDEMTMTRPNP